MKKIKELWINNKIMVVLFIILILCFIAICFVAATYFFGGSSSVYGDRLENQDNYTFTDEMEKSYIDKVEESELVKSSELHIKGRILYISVEFEKDTSLVEAQSIITSSIEAIDARMLEYYDLNITIESEASENSEGFLIMGARNVVANTITWGNDTKVEIDEEGE